MIKKIIGWIVVSHMFPLMFMMVSTLAISNGYDHMTTIESPYLEGYVMGWFCNVAIGGFSLVLYLALRLIINPKTEEE